MKKLFYITLFLFAVAFMLWLSAPFWYEQITNLLTKEITMEITSPVFEHGGEIPSKYTCDGGNTNPALEFNDVPEGAKSLALIVDDPDAPVGTFTHWVVWNIDSAMSGIGENSVPEGAVEGTTSFGSNGGYGGPCPPGSSHRYFFKLFALDTAFDLPKSAGKEQLESVMKGHVLAEAELMGKYKRQ